MSRPTRCQCCNHTPNSRAQEGCATGCSCHARLPIHRMYGPTPVTRTPSKATGQLCPLVRREALPHRSRASQAAAIAQRLGWRNP